jgi:hypothetical protein
MLAWTAVSSMGCYRYVPLDSGAPPLELGDELRAHLSTPSRVQLEQLAAENVIRVDGEFINSDDDRLVVSAFWLKAGTGLEFKGVGETVALPRTSIAVVEKKKFSAVATAAATAVAVVIGVLAGIAFGTAASGAPGPGPPPPPAQ